MSTAGNTLIREVADELHQIITNINHAFVNGDLDHLPDPLEERDRLINQALCTRINIDNTVTRYYNLSHE